MTETNSVSSEGFNPRGFIRSVVLNAVVPLGLYTVAKNYLSASEFGALAIAALFPLVDSVVGVVRARKLDLIAGLALLGIIVSMVGIAIGGDPRILLIRESLLTGVLGIACFVSLLFFPRPLMFYFGRQFATGGDPSRIAQYEATYQIPQARRVHRLITVVWGCVFTAEFLLRIVMVYTLPIPVVLAVSPIIFGAAVIGTITWTFAYARRAQARGAAARAVAERAAGQP